MFIHAEYARWLSITIERCVLPWLKPSKDNFWDPVFASMPSLISERNNSPHFGHENSFAIRNARSVNGSGSPDASNVKKPDDETRVRRGSGADSGDFDDDEDFDANNEDVDDSAGAAKTT